MWSQNVPVCTFKTSPCVLAPRAHVETCARGAGIHGDVLNVHTEAFLNVHSEAFLNVHTGFSTFFSAFRNTQTHTPHEHTTTKQHHDHQTTPRPQRHTPHSTHTTSHGDRARDRERRVTRQDKTRQDKTREEKMKEETRQEGKRR